jgi:hypothetical protein
MEEGKSGGVERNVRLNGKVESTDLYRHVRSGKKKLKNEIGGKTHSGDNNKKHGRREREGEIKI